MRSVLTVVGGLPATGKSTIAELFAGQTSTPYLRVDRIEQAVVEWSALAHLVGPVGYAVAHALALEQLRLGQDVVVECVNPGGDHPRPLGRHGRSGRRRPDRGGDRLSQRRGAPPPRREPPDGRPGPAEA